MKQILKVLAFLVVFGLLKWPAESHIEKELKERHFRETNLDLSTREQLGQMSFAAAFGGFRSLIASIMGIQAYLHWENVKWSKVESAYNVITQLQPRSVNYWDEAHWHMAYNAASYNLHHSDASDALKKFRASLYAERGKKFLEDGIRNNPDSSSLFYHLGRLYRDKLGDHEKAAEVFGRGQKTPDAPSWLKRFHVYELAKVPGREKEAYEKAKELYAMGKRERKPSLLTTIQKLENQLQIPKDQRVNISSSLPPRAPQGNR